MSATSSPPTPTHKDPCTAWELADLAIRLAMLNGTSIPDFTQAKSCIQNSWRLLGEMRREHEKSIQQFELMVAKFHNTQPSPLSPEEKAINAVLKKFGDVYELNHALSETVFMRSVMGNSGKSKARRQAVLRKAYRHHLEHSGYLDVTDEEVDRFMTGLFPINNVEMFLKVLGSIAPFVPTGKRATKVQYRDKKTGRAKKRIESVKSSKIKKVEDGTEVA